MQPITASALSRVARELYQRPAWLLAGETIEWDAFLDGDHDEARLRGVIHSTINPWVDSVFATLTIDGKVIRVAQFGGNKSMLVKIVYAGMRDVLHALEERWRDDAGLLKLACDALNDEDALSVFMDAALEAGLISGQGTADTLSQKATAYARQILAPRIFAGWSTTRWPVNEVGDWRGRLPELAVPQSRPLPAWRTNE
jgi:hypothetical protein